MKRGPGNMHPVCFELENSGIRVGVGDCTVTERRRWLTPYEPVKLYMCTTRTDVRCRVCVRPWFRTAEPLGEGRYENWITHTHYTNTAQSGWPGLVDRVFAFHAGSRVFDSYRRHMSKRFSRSSRPGYPHPVCSELENSDIRVGVSD